MTRALRRSLENSRQGETKASWTNASVIQDRVSRALPDYFIKYEELAERLGKFHGCSLACHAWCAEGEAVANLPRSRGEFRRAKSSAC